MENSRKNISASEEKWLKLLFNYSKEKFTLTPLPSHDHFHHLRVWNYAKSILLDLSVPGIVYSREEIEAILIAVFFHDMGMIITRDKEHGLESRNLCRQFFSSRPLFTPSNIDLILDIIERHDDKDYANYATVQHHPSPAVILNISDDLDAFGNIGVYRYTEIYHFRGISINELPSRILPNLEGRFQHFAQQLGQLQNLISLHRKRFERTRDFFINLEKELENCNSTEGIYQNIMQILIEFSNSSGSDIQDYLKGIDKTDLIPGVNKFFDDFLFELEKSDLTYF
jgi:HD superfamily phosphodiesterase